MLQKFRRVLFSVICAVVALMVTGPAQAVNWLKLQGTEPPDASARARIWGFIQPQYQAADGTRLQAGGWSGQNANFNVVAPDRKSESQFQLRRARIGVRGTGFTLDSNVNYFFLAEFGNNGITAPGNGKSAGRITDASVTLSHIPGARIRVGQFKFPGSEEGLQAIHVFDYVNFTNISDQLLLERFVAGDGSQDGIGSYINKPVQPVNAFRDVGIQVFDWFTKGKWEHTYAFMVGNGNGITRGDNNGNKEVRYYWSSERMFAGAGSFPSEAHLAPPLWNSRKAHGARKARTQGWKLYAWYHDGKRTLTMENPGTYDRKRYGIGSTLRKGKLRVGTEYIKGKGMIRNGTDAGAVPGSANNANTAVADINIETDGEANGWYVDVGYLVTPKLELDVRFDVYNRSTHSANKERKFETLTLGAQYFFNKKSRLIVNYEFRNAEAPNLPGSATPNRILDGIDDRITAQLLIVF